MQFASNDSYLYEDKESFSWSTNGDIDARKDLSDIKKMDSKGILWSLVISFPPDLQLTKDLLLR